MEIDAAETRSGRKNAVRKIDRAHNDLRCWTSSAIARPITIWRTTTSTASKPVTANEWTTAWSEARWVKFCRPTNVGGLMMSQEKRENANVKTIGAAVNARIANADRETISQPNAFSRRV